MPHLLGFVPRASLVVIGPRRLATASRSRSATTCPTRPTRGRRGNRRARGRRHRLAAADRDGGGRIRCRVLVDPVAGALRYAARQAGIDLQDFLRVEDGRYWSYLCGDEACCPAAGTPSTRRTPASAALAAPGTAGAGRPGRGGGPGRAARRQRRGIHAPGHPPGRAARQPAARQGPQVRPARRRAADDRRRGAERGGRHDRHLPRRRQVRHRLPDRVDHGGAARPAGQGRRLGPDGPGARWTRTGGCGST